MIWLLWKGRKHFLFTNEIAKPLSARQKIHFFMTCNLAHTIYPNNITEREAFSLKMIGQKKKIRTGKKERILWCSEI